MAGLGAIGILGPLAGGFNQTFAPGLQQLEQDSATGQGLYAMMGMSPPQQQGGLGSLAGGAPNVPVQAPTGPQLGQGGVAQSPMPQPAAVSVPAPVLARGQPMTASGGQTPPIGQVPPSAASLQGNAPQQTAQLSPQLQGQQNQQQQPPDLSIHDGQFDFNHLMSNLVKQGWSPQKLGRIASSPAFARMLNQEGLNQYRNLGLGIRQENAETSRDRLSQQAQEFDKREAEIDKRQQNSIATRQNITGSVATFHTINASAQAKIAQINASVQRGDITPQDAQKQIQAINDDREKRIGEGIAKMNQFDPDKAAGESSALEEAQAAIKAGAPRDKVIERFKKNHPDLDASSLGQ